MTLDGGEAKDDEDVDELEEDGDGVGHVEDDEDANEDEDDEDKDAEKDEDADKDEDDIGMRKWMGSRRPRRRQQLTSVEETAPAVWIQILSQVWTEEIFSWTKYC